MRLNRPVPARRLRPARWAGKTPRRAVSQVVAGGIAAVALAAFAGWLAGAFSSESEPAARPPAERTARIDPVELTTAREWRPAARAPSILGLDPTRTKAFSAVPGLPVEAIVTLAPVDHPSLLSAAVRGATEGSLPRALLRPLAGQAAWHYKDLPAARDRVMDVAVAPSSAGMLTVACIAPEAFRSVLGDCAAGLRSLSLQSGSWLQPAPDLAMRLRLPVVLRELDRDRVAARAALRQARTPADQSRHAGRLEAAYVRAANILTAFAGDAGAGTRVTEALHRCAAAYRRLGAAARDGDRPRFEQARRAVSPAETGLAAAVRAY